MLGEEVEGSVVGEAGAVVPHVGEPFCFALVQGFPLGLVGPDHQVLVKAFNLMPLAGAHQVAIGGAHG